MAVDRHRGDKSTSKVLKFRWDVMQNGVPAPQSTETVGTICRYRDTYDAWHPWWVNKRLWKDDGTHHYPWDVGGPFTAQTHECFSGSVYIDEVQGTRTNGNWWHGDIVAHSLGGVAKSYPAASLAQDIYPYGAVAIARTLPTNPHANVAQAIAELKREGLPKIPSIKLLREETLRLRDAPKHASDEYLNLMFGWTPLIKDLKDLVFAVRKHNEILSDYLARSGKHTKKRWSFPREQTVTVQDKGFSYGAPVTSSNCYQSPGKYTITTTTTRNVWFSACYTYHVSGQESFSSRVKLWNQKANHLLGCNITPTVLWELAPWSWLVDWFATVGPLITNVSAFAFDDVVMHYGYVMETKSIKTEHSVTGLTLRSGRKVNLTQTYLATTKSRWKATPYGFGLNPATFTDRQWSILAALGIARTSTHL